MNKITVNNLSSGQIVRSGYKRGDRDFTDDNQFVSFSIGGNSFFDLKQIKDFLGVSNLRDLEAKATELDLAVYAEWINCDEGHHWSAYLWQGAFRCGSSADRLTLSAA